MITPMPKSGETQHNMKCTSALWSVWRAELHTALYKSTFTYTLHRSVHWFLYNCYKFTS